MLVDLALHTGLRVSEIARLRVQDVDTTVSELTVVRSKKRKLRKDTIAVGRGLFTDHLAAYIHWLGRPRGPFWVGERGKLTPGGLQKIWLRAVKRAGLKRQMSIHCARHTFAMHLLRRTGNLRRVQLALGHSSPETTANIYLPKCGINMHESLDQLYEYLPDGFVEQDRKEKAEMGLQYV